MAKEKEEKQQETKKSESYELVEVPTQTGIYIKNNKTNEVLDDKAVLVEILNGIEDIKKVMK